MDIFNTCVVSRVVSRLEPVKPFLLNSFFPNIQLEATEEIRFDVEHRSRRLAPFVSPMVAGQVVQSKGYTTKSFKPAYIKDKRIFNAQRPFVRAIGERIGGGDVTPEQRLQYALSSELSDQIAMLTRRQELMAAEVLRTGKTIVEGDLYPRVEVDFGRDPDLTLRLVDDARWGEGSAVDPLEDLAQWSRLVTQKSGATANIAVMDLKAWQIFSAAPSVQDLLDRQRGTATANPAVAGEGGRHMATIGDLEIWVYQSWFNDPDTEAQIPYLPRDVQLLKSEASVAAREEHAYKWAYRRIFPNLRNAGVRHVPRRFHYPRLLSDLCGLCCGGAYAAASAWFCPCPQR